MVTTPTLFKAPIQSAYNTKMFVLHNLLLFSLKYDKAFMKPSFSIEKNAKIVVAMDIRQYITMVTIHYKVYLHAHNVL